MIPAAISAATTASVGAETEDRSEQGAGSEQAVAAAGSGAEQREEVHAEPEDRGERDPDRDVVGVRAVAERAEQQRDQDRRGEQPDADVDPGGGGGERAGERDVAERVAGEHLRAQDDEVADQPARERDRGAGEPGVADELVREHQAVASAGRERRCSRVG